MRFSHWLTSLYARVGFSGRDFRGRQRQRRRVTSAQLEHLEDRVLLATWAGDIPNGTVWPAGQVQRITGDVHIPLGSTLTIQQGAVIKFNDNSDIDFLVDGTLLAQGTAGAPIIFTELRDDTGGDTNGNGSANGPARSNWGALVFQASSTGSILNNVEVRYGGWRADAEVVVNGGQLTWTNGVVRDANGYGVRIANASPTLTNISYINSAFAAISMDLNSAPVISGVTMTNNGWNGLWMDPGTLPGNATWNNPDIVYILPDDITVPQGKTLTLGAGQIIKTGFRTELFVDGTLIANGTAAKPVIFANPADDTAGGDTNNNGTANNASNDASGGIVFSATSTGSVLDHVEVRNSGYDVGAAIVVNSAPITVTNSLIRNSVNAGMSLNSSTAVITGTVFQSSTLEAINATLSSNLTINGNSYSNNGINGLLMRGGSLAADATWNSPDTVYVLQDDVTVPQGKTLTIGAGQIIKAGFRTELFVNGTLNVNGTVAKPVIFASPSDDTAGGDTNNNGATNPANDPSGGIVFSSTSAGSVLDHVDVRHSGYDDNAAIMLYGASITLTNSVIRDAVHAGIWMIGGTMAISNTDFQRNTWLAIAADVASSITSGGGNTFSQNPVNGVVVLSGSLPANTSWSNPDITYVMDGNGAGVTIPVGVTLTLGAGQIIKVTNQREAFIVNGTLKALGTVAAPVICTSFADDSVGGDSNNNGTGSGPNPGDWNSWSFTATSTDSVLEYVELRYGNDAASGARPGMLNVTGSALTVSNSVFTGSNSVAIAARTGSTLTLINNLIVNNVGVGVHGSGGSQLFAINNTIDGNSHGVAVDGVGTIAELTNNLITNNGRAGIVRSNLAVLNAQFNDVFNPTAVEGNYVGLASLTGVSGNLAVNPLYVNRVGRDFHLLAGSPAIDAGTSDGAPVDDRDFNFRTDNPAVNNMGEGSSPFYDLGAYESAGRPRAVKSTPNGDVQGVVSEIVLTFREAMNQTSFSPAADVISFTGPTGPLAITGFRWINKYQLAVNFNAVAKAGPYELVFAPSILNTNGQTLDTDGDGTRGETIQDRYAATWTILPPRVVDHSPADYVAVTADHVSFTFDREMDQSSFSLSDIVSFRGPNGAIPITGFTWTNSRTLQVNFAPQTTLGYYEMVLGSNIASLGGDLLDQNSNHVGGEAGDTYSAGFTLAQVFHVSGNISQSATWAGLIIVDANVTIPSGVTITIAPGTIVKLQDLTSITVNSGGTLLSNGTVAQPVIITSVHDDSVGGDTDANGNRRGPQAGDWLSIHINGGTGRFESTHILHGGGSATGTWNNSGMIKTSGSANLTISRSLVRDALFDGVLVQGGLASITNTIITGTDRGVSSGLASANVQVLNSTIVDNRIGLLGHSGILNVVNSIVSHNLQFGIDNDIDPDPTVSFTDIFNPGATDTRGFTNPIGSNGNISVDPQYVNPETGNYRLNFGSPAIDAANGGAAPTTDQAGSPRYDDPRTINTGTITGNNAFADMGAFEFVEGAPSDLDLIVTTVGSPVAVDEGDMVAVSWKVKNVGTAVATGTWHDAIYLSTDPVWTPDDILVGEALHAESLGPNQSYSSSADVKIPGMLPGTYYFLIRTNSDNAVFEGSNLTNNVTASLTATTLDVPTLSLGSQLTGQLDASGDAFVYKLVVPADSDVKVTLDGPNGTANELYVLLGDVPTRQSFDGRGAAPGQPDQSVHVSSVNGGTYYVLVYGANVPSGESFTIRAALAEFSVDAVSPATVSNSGLVTFTIGGNAFDVNSQPRLVDSANQVMMPTHVYFTDSGELAATFDLTGHPVGLADVQVINGNVTRTLADGVNVVVDQPGRLIATVSSPSRVRLGRTFALDIVISNDGGSDLLAPILQITSSGLSVLSLDPDDPAGSTSLFLLGTNATGPAGILPPGASRQITVYARSISGGDDVFTLSVGDYPSTPIDYDALEPLMRPADITDAEWDPLFAQLQLQIGPTWTGYQQRLAADATLLPASAGLNYSLADVFALEVTRAEAALSTSVTGRLFEGDTTHPLGNVSIFLLDASSGTEIGFEGEALTDGTFIIPEVEPGTYEVTFEGFVSATPIQITVGAQSVTGLSFVVTPAASISGSVVLSGSGIPLSDVSVTAIDASGNLFTTQTEDGIYHFNSLPAGDYIVTAGGDGLTQSSFAVPGLLAGEQRQHVTLSITEGGIIQGTVNGPGGLISGAVVSAIGADGQTLSTTSGSNGTFTITGLTSQKYTIAAFAAGLASAEAANINVDSGATVSGVNVTLAVGGGLQGTIHSSGGVPSSAFLLVTLTRGNDSFTGQTDSDGNFVISGLPAGNYTVTVNDQGFMTNSTATTIVGGSVGTLNLTLTPLGKITGKILNSVNGQGVAGVTVFADNANGFAGSAVTAADGTYEIIDLDAATYTIGLGDPGESPIARKTAVLTTNAPTVTSNFTVAVAGVISGTVFQADGTTPDVNASVALSKGGSTVLVKGVDMFGHYAFVILSGGSYQIEATDVGLVFPTQNASVNGGSTASNVNFIAGARTLSGTVSQSANGIPVANALVTITNVATGLVYNEVDILTTDANGQFQVTGLLNGAYRVTVEANGFAVTLQTVTVSANTPQVSIALSPDIVLAGTIRDSVSGNGLAGAEISAISTTIAGISASAIADNNGNYQLLGLPAGTYRVYVIADGHQFVTQSTVLSSSQTLDISAPTANIHVQGTISNADGALVDANVFAIDANGFVVAEAVTAADGHYDLTTLAPGSYSIIVDAQGHSTPTASSVSVASSQNLTGINFELDVLALSDPLPDEPVFTANSVVESSLGFLDGLLRTAEHLSREPTLASLDGKIDMEHCAEESNAAIAAVSAIPELFADWASAQSALRWSAGRELISIGLQVADTAGKFVLLAKSATKDKALEAVSTVKRIMVDLVPSLIQDIEKIVIARFFNQDDQSVGDKLADGISAVNEALAKLVQLKDKILDAHNEAIKAFSSIRRSITATVALEEIARRKETLKKIGAFLGVIDALLSAYQTFNEGLDAYKSLLSQFSALQNAKNAYSNGVAKANAAIYFLDLCRGDHQGGPVPPQPPKQKDPSRSPTSIRTSNDPNDKIGPAGFGSPGFIQPGVMSYEVEFENDPRQATAAAQIVIVTDTLDSDLDENTVFFTSFAFGSHSFTVPEGLSNYQTTIDLRPDGINLLVPITLDFNPETRVLTATFESLDPVTGLPPDDPDAGFLPVNNASHDGEGLFTYTVRPKNGLGTGTVIDNQASIVFDTNAAILTPTTHHTLDVGAPTSQVSTLPQISPGNFTVNWSGTDDGGGSGIGVYDIYVSVDGGDYTIWKSAIAETSAIYTGQGGKTYRFFSIARDNVGHIEPAALAADATTTVAELPPVIENQSFNVPENSAANAVVGIVQATGSSALTYSILSGNTGNNFTIDPATGSIKVAAGAVLNFEGTTTFTLNVQVTDSGSPSKSSSASMTINVTDVNEAPVIPTGQTFNVSASALTGAVVGTVTANDPDTTGPNSTKTFSLPNGSTIFAINSAGQITVANAAALVAAAGQTITLQVTDTDGGTSPLSGSESVSINVSPANTAPVLSTPGAVSTFYGNLKTPVKIAPTLTVTDADGAATIATIIVSLPQGDAKKNPDVVTFPGLAAIGTSAVVEANGRKQITITLKPGTTNAAVQAMLDNMTFQTKAKGLKVLSRAVKIEVIDQTGLHSNVITQNVTVAKKAPKPPKQPRD